MSLRQTPFHAAHVAHGARMIDFGGWDMPVQYAGILAEHAAVRSTVGLFDVSHMGEVRVRGPRGLEALDQLTCNACRELPVGSALYSAILNHRGGVVDDIYLYRLAVDDVLVCVNASNQEKDFAWLAEHNPLKGEVEITYESELWAQVAIQGPRGPEVVQALASGPGLDHGGALAMGRFTARAGTFAGVDGCVLARTGYTGEDGFEVFIPARSASGVWQAIVDAGAPHGLQPVGLGARDTLRLEAGNLLYGNDMDEDVLPQECRLAWVTPVEKGPFIGRDAILARQADRSILRRLVGLEVDGRIARPHNPVLSEGAVVGEVTSGTRSPSLEKNIALARVHRDHVKVGTRLQVDVRGKLADAVVVPLPFFKRS